MKARTFQVNNDTGVDMPLIEGDTIVCFMMPGSDAVRPNQGVVWPFDRLTCWSEIKAAQEARSAGERFVNEPGYLRGSSLAFEVDTRDPLEIARTVWVRGAYGFHLAYLNDDGSLWEKIYYLDGDVITFEEIEAVIARARAVASDGSHKPGDPLPDLPAALNGINPFMSMIWWLRQNMQKNGWPAVVRIPYAGVSEGALWRPVDDDQVVLETITC